jgi:tetratricopeptide (TPR) repeat protein
LLILGLAAKDLSQDLVTIEPISVPKTFSENGYTPEVASRRLRDALNDYAVKANTLVKVPSIAPRDELPKITVPKIDLSLDTIESFIRSVAHFGSHRSISGEMVIRRKLAWLRLRVDGEEVHSSPNGIDPETADELFAAAVPAVMERIRPYVVASTMYDRNPKLGAQKADEIIADRSASDIDKQWAYILKGNFFQDQGDKVQAEIVARKAVGVNDGNAYAHFNLGGILDDQCRFDEAIVEYRRAIKLNPAYPNPHNNLAIVLDRQGKRDEAIAEYRNAIGIDQKYAYAHYNLSLVLSKQGKIDDARIEMQRAAELDPDIKDDPEPACATIKPPGG